MITQLPLFDLSSIPKRSKRRCYLHGYSEAVARELFKWCLRLDDCDYPYRITALLPSALYPTQRTIDPKTVQYYRLKKFAMNNEDKYPVVVHAFKRYYVLNGHHRWQAAINKPRLWVKLYEFDTIISEARAA